ncbi:hypothetical protein BpHYR1_047069 [Brachionus plicatilis]|uniref:Uncharacterized protein n=1 Tax=Brachionus plicatilis TaxID=10195 RepID=A0A3M7QVN5_BRAPC|nr:hypothetical protein BpHYR1_047069 [Brachionus plicatilis]
MVRFSRRSILSVLCIYSSQDQDFLVYGLFRSEMPCQKPFPNRRRLLPCIEVQKITTAGDLWSETRCSFAMIKN